MNGEFPPLSSLLFEGTNDLNGTSFPSRIKETLAWEHIVGTLGEFAEELIPSVVSRTVEELSPLLRLSLFDVFAFAWNKRRDLLKFKDRARFPENTTESTPLLPHTIETTYKPVVDVSIDGQKVSSFEFELQLSLEIEAGILEIRNGRIMALKSGEISGAAKLSCQGMELAQSESRKVALPGEIHFGEGIVID